MEGNSSNSSLTEYGEEVYVNTTEKRTDDTYLSTPNVSFEDLLLRPELQLGISDCGFKHPSAVQQACIPHAVKGMDIICQASNGIGKTAVYVLSTLQQLQIECGNVSVIVILPTRELALQVGEQYKRLSKFMTDVKINTFFGGLPVSRDEQILMENCPDIVIGTPGRILQLLKTKKLNLKHIRHFILDECDEIFQLLPMRRTVQEIFISTPRDKQVMMFSATIPKEIRIVCKRFMKEPYELYMNDDSKMNLLGLQQFYICLEDARKTRVLVEFLDQWKFDQAIIFVSSSQRCDVLAHILVKLNYSTIAIHKGLTQVERMSRCTQFISAEKQILVTTNLFGRGMDVPRINLAINYDTPENTDSYLHRVTRAGRFGAEAKVLSFISSEKDANMLTNVQDQFDVEIRKIEQNSLHFISKKLGDTKNENIPAQTTTETGDKNMDRIQSILWAEDTMNRLCTDFEHATFL